jgi:hypothetical protein
VRANGGSAYDAGFGGGGGGGGRVAVIYDQAAQSNLNLTSHPRVLFSANQGTGLSPYSSYMGWNGRPGTLYFPDTSLLTGDLLEGGEWMLPTLDWSPSSVMLTNGLAAFPSGFAFRVISDMTVKGSGILEITNPTEMTITGDLTITNGGQIHLYTVPNLTIGHDLRLGNAGTLHINSAPTGSVSRECGTLVDIGRDVTIASTAWIYPTSHPTNGGSVFFQMRNLTVATNAGFSATVRGYRGVTSSTVVACGPGGGKGRCGASHAGVGGTGVWGTPGTTIYGLSNAPIHAGSCGGCGSDVMWPALAGGGVVRLDVRQTATLDGSLLANGEDAVPSSPSGGGAGGSIYLTCHTLFGGSNAVLSARGGNGSTAASWAGGSGGGGRIAVWRMREDYFFRGSVTATNGIAWPGYAGTPGTVVFGWIPPSGTLFYLR